MANLRTTRMFSKNIMTTTNYEGLKERINIDSTSEVATRKKTSVYFAFGAPILAVTVALGVFLGVNLSKRSSSIPVIQDIVRPVEHTIVFDEHTGLDAMDYDISLLPEDEEHWSYLLRRRDIGRLINNMDEMNSFISDYSINPDSNLYSKLANFEEADFQSKSFVSLICFEEKGYRLSIVDVGQLIYNLSKDEPDSQLCAIMKRSADNSAEETLYTVIVAIEKEAIEKMEFRLTGNDVKMFFQAK